MISNQNKKLAQWAMEYAQKNGCQGVRISVYSGSNTSIDLRNNKTDKLQQAAENGMSLNLFVDGRYGTFSTNRLVKKELEGFIKQAIDSTRYLAKDEARTLPDAARYYKGDKPDLNLMDNKFDGVNPDLKMSLANDISNEAMGKDERIISVDSSYSDNEYSSYRITSNGFEGDQNGTSFALSVSVSMRGEGEARPSSYWYESALFLDDLKTTGIGQKALERVLQKLGQKKVASGKYTMIVDQLNSSQLLRPIIDAMSGGSLQQKNSFLLDKVGQKIGNDLFTLTDEPHRKKAPGARYFDFEGVATQPTNVIENGTLNMYLIDTYIANKMKIEPTISSLSIPVLKPGNKNLEQLIADIDKGILVTGFNGGNSNSTTGDFSYGIEGFLIENGKRTQPISEMNVTGNMLALWSSLAAIGNDPRPNSSWQIPSLVFEGVDFSGL
ncbi:MAG: TldD/PmbA family protein [Dysgonamonadaceae bacterium]|jgi:PmbA protein|nr:TldD/PmbA family protein [Dysgonamonadaceae bacterium]